MKKKNFKTEICYKQKLNLSFSSPYYVKALADSSVRHTAEVNTGTCLGVVGEPFVTLSASDSYFRPRGCAACAFSNRSIIATLKFVPEMFLAAEFVQIVLRLIPRLHLTVLTTRND